MSGIRIVTPPSVQAGRERASVAGELEPQKYPELIAMLGSRPTAEAFNRAQILLKKLTGTPYFLDGFRQFNAFLATEELGPDLMAMCQPMIKSEDWKMRLVSMELFVGMFGSKSSEVRQAVLKALLEGVRDPNKDLRHWCYLSVGRNIEKVPPHVLHSMVVDGLRDSDPRIRADTARICRSLDFDNAMSALRELIGDQDGRVRANALASLLESWTGAAKDLVELEATLEALWTDNSNRVMADMAVAFHESHRQKSRSAIEQLLSHRAPTHVISGIFAAYQVAPDLLQTHFERLLAFPQKTVREALTKFAA